MLLKCCTHYASKFGKLSSGHRTGKGQFSFKSQGKAMSKKAQTIAQLHASHTLSKVRLKILHARLLQYMNCKIFHMLKLDVEKAEEPEIKLPTSFGSLKKQESSRKTPTSAVLSTPKPFTKWITTNWTILKKTGIPDHLTCLLRNPYARQEATVRSGHGTTDWVQIGKGVHQGCILSHN